MHEITYLIGALILGASRFLFQALSKNGLEDNGPVIFLADNGH